MKKIQRTLKNERGMSYVFVGLGLTAFIGASMLAIDVGMLMTARNQAQNAADAGALAGAVALAFDDFDDRTPTGPAVRSAIAGALLNKVMGADVSVLPADVEFLNDEGGQPTRVKVTAYRNSDRDNPLQTLIARYFGMETASVSATATAEASPANAMTCVKPFTIPDRWLENGTTPSTDEDEFDPATDVYVPLEDGQGNSYPNYTGYDAERDKGMLIELKSSNDTKIAPSFYKAWAIPGNSGADDYRRDIGGCNTLVVPFGYDLTPEPGNMVGPTKQGMEDLIAKDPYASWDDVNDVVVSEKNPSPRVVAIPLFDPMHYWTGKQNSKNASLRAVNYLGFFVEEMQGNTVIGRITPIGGLFKGSGFGPAPDGAFPKVIRLVK
jgi:Flp pilus assembly protein TadG